MKKLVISIGFVAATISSASANVLCWVDGYTKANGTVVASYIRSQTACVTTTPAFTSGGMSAATAAKVLGAVGILLTVIELNKSINRETAENLRKESHKIINCSAKKEIQFVYGDPGEIQIVQGKEKAVVLGYGLAVELSLSDSGSFEKHHIIGKTTFNPETVTYYNTNYGKVIYDCAVSYEIEIKDQ